MTVNAGSTRRAGDSRERLLRATAAVLAERGYAQTRLTEIATRAGMRPPAVYYYFPSRDDLVAEVMRVGQERVREHVEAAVSASERDGGSRLDRIEAAVAAHLRIQLELSEFATAVSRNSGHMPEPVRTALQEGSDRYHQTWRDLLEGARAAGELRPGLDPGIARMLVIGALNWSVEWWTGPDTGALVATTCRWVRSALAGPNNLF